MKTILYLIICIAIIEAQDDLFNELNENTTGVHFNIPAFNVYSCF